MNESDLLNILLENLQTKVTPQIYEAYFKDLHVVSSDESTVTIACKNIFTKQIIETRFHNILIETLHSVTTNSMNLELIIRTIQKDPGKPAMDSLFGDTKVPAPPPKSIDQPNPTSLQGESANQKPVKSPTSYSILNPKYTFENFIVGNGNQLAHAAAIAISSNPGNAYNPFFIYGNVGLGKTHLMQAIGNEVIRNNPNAKVLYCSTETFLNEMVNSIRTQKNASFREKYRALDVLILDDIQFISNKEMLQEEFFNTFNTLYQSGKQIIIASDRPPTEISHLEDRLRSRFEGGLVADIKSPNVETRIAILQTKLMERGEFLPEKVISAVAESVDSNIRELEGALLKVSIYYKMTGNLDIEEISKLLGSKANSSQKQKVNPLDIMKGVCAEMDIELKDIKSSKRNYDISLARQICMYLLKDILKLQLVKIAKHVGRKDHTTVMHGISKIEQMLESDDDTQKLIDSIKNRIYS